MEASDPRDFVREAVRENSQDSPPKTNQKKKSKKLDFGRYGLPQLGDVSDMPTLDWIHIIFLIYSAAHNFINAWHRAHNPLFFLFVVVGILSVELMLWTIYKHWKDGRLAGKMLAVGKLAGAIAMFYATAGILAQAQAGGSGEWLTLYYQWILPSSAPVMFFFAFLIQSADPIMNAERDATVYAHLMGVEEKRDVLDQRRMELDYRRDVRRLKTHLHKQKLIAIWAESGKRRTRYIIKRTAQIQMPAILKSIGLPVDKIGQKRSVFFWRNPQLPAGGKGDDLSLN